MPWWLTILIFLGLAAALGLGIRAYGKLPD